MFQPRKPKAKKRPLKLSKDEDGSSEDESALKEDQGDKSSLEAKSNKKKKKKSKKKTASNGVGIPLSFGQDDDEDYDITDMKKRKKKKSKIGFGASTMMDDDMNEEEQTEDVETAAAGSYSAHSLQQLRENQRTFIPAALGTKTVVNHDKTEQLKELEEEKVLGDKDFIPLDDNEKQEDDRVDDTTTVEKLNRINKTEEYHIFVDDEYGSRVVGQQSVRMPSAVGVQNNNGAHRSSQVTSTISLDKIKLALQQGLNSLKESQNEIKSSVNRKVSEKKQFEQEIKKLSTDVTDHEVGMNWYEEFRQKVASWVGALRDLDSQLNEVLEALLKLYADRFNGSRKSYKSLVSDSLSYLRGKNLITNGESSGEWDEKIMQVDEFGRNVNQLHSLERVSRKRRRVEFFCDKLREEAEKIKVCCQYVDDYVHGDKEEQDSFVQKRNALSLAAEVAISETRDEFLGIKNIISISLEWQKKFPSDFTGCYAMLSISELVSVLIRLGLCRSWGVIGLKTSNKSDDLQTSSLPLDQLEVVQSIVNTHGNTNLVVEDNIGLCERCLEESIIKILLADVIPNLDFLSFGQLEFFIKDLSYVGEFISQKKCKDIIVALRSALSTALDEIELPEFIDNESMEKTINLAKGGDIEAVIVMAQIYRLNRLIFNTCTSIRRISPVFEEYHILVKVILIDAVGSKLLPYINRLREVDEETAKSLLNEVLEIVDGAGWLNDKRFMLITGPLRIAASTFI